MKSQVIKLTGISSDKQKFEDSLKEDKAGFVFTLVNRKNSHNVKFWLATCDDKEVKDKISQFPEIKFDVIEESKARYELADFGAEFSNLTIESVLAFVKSSNGILNGKFAFRLNPYFNAKRGITMYQLRDAIGCELSTGNHHGDDYLIVDAAVAEFAVALMFEEGIYFNCLTEKHQIPHHHNYMF